jgi:iron complex transport system substrate-binding protein
MARRTARRISGFVRLSRLISTLAALLIGGAALADAPQRVVSVNLCTDQLAMMVAAPGQLVAVTPLAANPRSSAMAEQAAGIAVHHGRAEEIYLLPPDLVLAGRFTDRATVDMLRRLGIRVEEFDPAYDLRDVPDRLARIGKLLGQESRAAALIDEFDAGLAQLAQGAGKRPAAALYYANGYTSGDASLAGQILRAAGFENVAQAMGYGAIGALPLELLAMAGPDVVITGNPYPGQSRAEAIMQHPVVRALKRGRVTGTVTDRDWVCGTPYVLRAVETLVTLRRAVEAGK